MKKVIVTFLLIFCSLSILSGCTSNIDIQNKGVEEEIDKEYVYYLGEKYEKSQVSAETLEWLEWFNSLDELGQLSVNFVPKEFIKQSDLGDTEVIDVNSDNVILNCKVVSKENNSLLVMGLTDSYTSLYTILGQYKEFSELQEGDIINILFDGNILETYPAQIGNIDKIVKVESSDNLVNMFVDVIMQLYNEDTGLNSGINVITFDMTEVENLSNLEKEAIIYKVWCETGIEINFGTHQELLDDGQITENGYDKGLLFKVKTEDTVDNSFNFSISKYRGPLGAYFYVNCKATKIENVWNYSIGEEMIS